MEFKQLVKENMMGNRRVRLLVVLAFIAMFVQTICMPLLIMISENNIARTRSMDTNPPWFNSNTTTRIGPCNYQAGIGHFEPNSWNWINGIHPNDCKVFDYASLFKQPTSQQAQQKLKTETETPITFLFIGNSIELAILTSVFNGSGFMKRMPLDTNHHSDPSLRNTASKRNDSAAIYSDAQQRFNMAFFKIFGMHHTCKNGHFAFRIDNRRQFRKTYERISNLLPLDILEHLPNATKYFVLVGGTLWDLSNGCNSRLGVTAEYQNLYRTGIIDIHRTIKQMLPNDTLIGWRTSPPVTSSYDQQMTRKKRGRTRANQAVLNQVLRETVQVLDLGIVVDWWAQATNISETNLQQLVPDGRHYRNGPAEAFFNLWLNAAFE